MADRFKHAASTESLIFHTAIIHHNYIKPHIGKTPAEAAGILLQDNNVWLTLIQNAVSTA